MASEKICLLGAFSAGKTSLVDQYVHAAFSKKYLSTVGVKISKKNIETLDANLTLVLWDMEGKDMYADVNLSYLRGAKGYFIVVDGMRRETVQIALDLYNMAQEIVGDIPCRFLLNKADCESEWEISPKMIKDLERKGVRCLRTSAKTREGVAEAFEELTQEIMLRCQK